MRQFLHKFYTTPLPPGYSPYTQNYILIVPQTKTHHTLTYPHHTAPPPIATSRPSSHAHPTAPISPHPNHNS